jgi:hypothetical protein
VQAGAAEVLAALLYQDGSDEILAMQHPFAASADKCQRLIDDLGRLGTHELGDLGGELPEDGLRMSFCDRHKTQTLGFDNHVERGRRCGTITKGPGRQTGPCY